LNNIKVYITHYQQLIERKKNILLELNNVNLEAEFIIDYDKELLINSNDNKINELLKKFDKTKLNYAQISLILKHIEIYKKISVNNEYNYAVIFEDDVIFNKNFREKFDIYFNQLPDDWDMCFLGDCCNLHIPEDKIVKNINIYYNPYSKCCDSYLVSKKCSIKLINYLDNILNISLPIDHLLNDIIKFYNLNVYWVEPTICSQLSDKKFIKGI
jgi:GR25 family glycosyltransferase involved in LPS biosynthesis